MFMLRTNTKWVCNLIVKFYSDHMTSFNANNEVPCGHTAC